MERKSEWIALAQADEEYAFKQGRERFNQNAAKGNKPKFEIEGRIFKEQLGAAAEYAVAQFLGVGWKPLWTTKEEWVNKKKRPLDIDGYEIRSTSVPEGPMYFYPWDADAIFVCVYTSQHPKYEIAGWTTSKFVKEATQETDHYYLNGRKIMLRHKAWVWPKDCLWPMSALLEIDKKKLEDLRRAHAQSIQSL